jgi:hypothetical protein
MATYDDNGDDDDGDDSGPVALACMLLNMFE